MNIINRTQVTEFVFSGLTNDENLAPLLFIFLFHLYFMTIMANIGLLTIVQTTPELQNPMYYFLSYLSLIDVFCSSAINPKMLMDLLSKRKAISFKGCALQFFLYASLVPTESLLFSTMSYDRYVAICHPLHYVSIMTKKKCLHLVLLSFFIGFSQSLVQTCCTFSLQFCESNFINHFYCDVLPVLHLSCSDTSICNKVTVYAVCILGIGPLMSILISYLLIIFSVSRLQSSTGRKKAFSTCSSHLMCIFIFYGSIFFTYLRPPSNIFTGQDKVASVFYTTVTPMLNPLIYSLRNQDVKRTIVASVQKQLAIYIWCSTST